MAILVRTGETVFTRTQICQYYQHHRMFTKPPKLGHLGARSLKIDSPTLYYLSWDFTLPLPSPSSSRFLLSSFCYPPPFFLSLASPCAPRCCSWVGGMERRWRQRGRVLQYSAFIFSPLGCFITGETQWAAAVMQHYIHTVLTGFPRQLIICCKNMTIIRSRDMCRL